MDHQQGPLWGRDQVDHELGDGCGIAGRNARVLVRSWLPDRRDDVTVTVAGGAAQLVLGGFEDAVQGRVWAHAVARVATNRITGDAETHAPPTDDDVTVHRDLAQAPDLAGVVRGMWSRIGAADVLVRPDGGDYEVVLKRWSVHHRLGTMTTGRAEEMKSAVLTLSGADVGMTDAAFEAEGHVVRVSVMEGASGFHMSLRPIRAARP